jgi:uncharacterized protein (TIGR03437 family)
VALNSDGTLNSQTNPAARGANVMLFATGEGLTSPADSDGIVEQDNSRVPVAMPTITIGGVNAPVVSDTSFTKDVSGVLDITATIPASIPTGVANVILSAGGVTTTQQVFIYVK